MTAKRQTILSVLISFTFYFIWTWYANNRVTDDVAILLRSALVQGSYSAFMTLTFASLLTWSIDRLKCHNQPYIAIIPPLAVQSTMVYVVNYLNQTPNLWLTIVPSIFFTALYGVLFTYNLLKEPKYQCDDHKKT